MEGDQSTQDMMAGVVLALAACMAALAKQPGIDSAQLIADLEEVVSASKHGDAAARSAGAFTEQIISMIKPD